MREPTPADRLIVGRDARFDRFSGRLPRPSRFPAPEPLAEGIGNIGDISCDLTLTMDRGEADKLLHGYQKVIPALRLGVSAGAPALKARVSARISARDADRKARKAAKRAALLESARKARAWADRVEKRAAKT